MEWQSSGCYRQATRVNLRFRCLCTFRYAPKSVLHGYKEPLVRASWLAVSCARGALFDSAGYGPISHGLKVATCMTQLPLAVRVAVAA